MEDRRHVPVLLNEVMQTLCIAPDAVVVDATYGRGGHAEELVKRLDASGRLLALDRDPAAAAAARARFAADARVTVEQAPFSRLEAICARHGLTGRVTALLFDLGMSSPQLDDPARGFSFRHDGPLDMRMDPGVGVSAAHWLAHAEDVEIARVLYEYGEERHARRIARAIIARRTERPIVSTRDLAEIVARAVPGRERHKDPATRTFQAIRIHINSELSELDAALPQALRVAASGARVAVISFHSLEDRRVKQFFAAAAAGAVVPPEIPLRAVDMPMPPLRLVGRARRATSAEVAGNPRARSAVLRVAERTGAAYV